MKHLTKILVAASVAVFFTACSSTSSESANEYASNEDAESDGMVCKLEKKIGSNRMQRVCYSVEERENMREAGRDAWLRMQRGTETGGDG